MALNSPLHQLSAAAVRYRIAVGPQVGRKTMTLRNPGAIVDDTTSSKPFTAARDGFSINAAVGCEARERGKLERVCRYMARWGNKAMTGEQVRWGLENLNVTEERLAALGLEGFASGLEITCEDHERRGSVIIQQWDGSKWNLITDWIEPMRDVVRPMIEKAAAAYAKENNITPRDCSKVDG